MKLSLNDEIVLYLHSSDNRVEAYIAEIISNDLEWIVICMSVRYRMRLIHNDRFYIYRENSQVAFDTVRIDYLTVGDIIHLEEGDNFVKAKSTMEIVEVVNDILYKTRYVGSRSERTLTVTKKPGEYIIDKETQFPCPARLIEIDHKFERMVDVMVNT